MPLRHQRQMPRLIRKKTNWAFTPLGIYNLDAGFLCSDIHSCLKTPLQPPKTVCVYNLWVFFLLNLRTSCADRSTTMQKSGKSVDSCHLAIVKLGKTTVFNRMLNMAAKKDTREKKDSLGIFFSQWPFGVPQFNFTICPKAFSCFLHSHRVFVVFSLVFLSRIVYIRPR